jgi:hypothetical protein
MAVVTCSGVNAPGVPVEVTLNLTATVMGCGDVKGELVYTVAGNVATTHSQVAPFCYDSLGAAECSDANCNAHSVGIGTMC